MAGCRDYPESVTPACAAQNLAEEQARQAASEVQRAQDLVDAENIAQVKKGKSPSQRFRAVLFLVNKSHGGTDESFEQFYATELEKLIEHYKKKLDA